MHIAVCGDHAAERKQMERLLDRESDARRPAGQTLYIDSYGDSAALLRAPLRYDLFFLDLSKQSGGNPELAAALRRAGVTAPIVLCDPPEAEQQDAACAEPETPGTAGGGSQAAAGAGSETPDAETLDPALGGSQTAAGAETPDAVAPGTARSGSQAAADAGSETPDAETLDPALAPVHRLPYPVRAADLAALIDLAIRERAAAPQAIAIRLGTSTRYIDPAHILYASPHGYLTDIHLLDGEVLSMPGTLREFYLLTEPAGGFLFARRNLVVNRSQIVSVSGLHMTLSNGERFPLTPPERLRLKKAGVV